MWYSWYEIGGRRGGWTGLGVARLAPLARRRLFGVVGYEALAYGLGLLLDLCVQLLQQTRAEREAAPRALRARLRLARLRLGLQSLHPPPQPFGLAPLVRQLLL